MSNVIKFWNFGKKFFNIFQKICGNQRKKQYLYMLNNNYQKS